MGQNTPPVRGDGYLLMNSIAEALQHRVRKSCVQIHITIRIETKPTINSSVFHRTHLLFLTLHTETLLKPQLFALGVEKTLLFARRPQEHDSFLCELVLDAHN